MKQAMYFVSDIVLFIKIAYFASVLLRGCRTKGLERWLFSVQKADAVCLWDDRYLLFLFVGLLTSSSVFYADRNLSFVLAIIIFTDERTIDCLKFLNFLLLS